jgi:hypothetical protein
MKKVTAVEWLVEQIFFSDQREKFEKYINQAKEMEKQQIIDAYDEGVYLAMTPSKTAEDYYQQTFKSE